MSKITAKSVALAICNVDPMAGQELGINDLQSVEQRAKNLLHETEYGPYIEDGDPKNWCNGKALVTIYMEPKGTNFDCVMPLDYYKNGLEVSIKASRLLPGDAYIDFINTAVAVVVE